MKKLFAIAIISICTVFITDRIKAQGCVAIRSTGGFCPMHPKDSTGWSLTINNRYLRSYKHYVGTDEQKYRIDSGTNVINHSYTMDIGLTRHINTRWSVSIDVPVVSNTRSSLYEHTDPVTHKAVGRFNTESFGIGDMRITAYRWLLNPLKAKKGNIQLGLGIKLPTGDYKYQDYFHISDTSTMLGPVDQSIQPGDGGTGLTTEINAFYNFSHNASVYANFFYLLNPREQNGTATARGAVASPTAVKYHTDVMSVPDQYLLRAGGNFTFNKITASAGVRYERLPAKDIIGGSLGFRRPGYILSFEPGIIYTIKNTSLSAFVPVAVVRDRIQSVSDIQRSADTKTHVQGDAAFADYTINLGISFRL